MYKLLLTVLVPRLAGFRSEAGMRELFFNYDCVNINTNDLSWDLVHKTLKIAASSDSLVMDVTLMDKVFSENLDVYFTDCPIGTLALGLLQAFRHQSLGNTADTS